eukprot:CAMPEP_0185834846 /NCGR_PEP_ID=MMETSP1353-20130828/6381_1 /TAXON_ID=1077150 /ORGANISM="Erythrolobus australicus, Strain CCMP3124" /LENGTH=128 /DNA_ID=CAMNT_0028533355 /DNA_START=23 /DNA_END=409 /DNA_ORIENTATION=+
MKLQMARVRALRMGADAGAESDRCSKDPRARLSGSLSSLCSRDGWSSRTRDETTRYHTRCNSGLSKREAIAMWDPFLVTDSDRSESNSSQKFRERSVSAVKFDPAFLPSESDDLGADQKQTDSTSLLV